MEVAGGYGIDPAPRLPVRMVARELHRVYRTPQLGNKRNPMNELLYILISLRTHEVGLARAYRLFKKRFPSWGDVAAAKRTSLATALRTAGLAEQKSRYLRAIVSRLVADFGRATLMPLRRRSEKEAEHYLLSLPGVGLKTARCVMLFSLGLSAFPVDTHCFRIMTRLGWLSRGDRGRRGTVDWIQEIVPRDIRRSLHLNLVAHGRTICRPTRPRCEVCPITRHCEFFLRGEGRVARGRGWPSK